jgi:hypothetical protein
MSIILDSKGTSINVRQKEHKSIQDHTKCFKTAHDVMKSHIRGPIIFTKFVANMSGYNITKTTEIQNFKNKHTTNSSPTHI